MSQLFFAADHAGVALKTELAAIAVAEFPAWKVVDLGTNNTDRVDYPTFAFAAAERVGRGEGLAVLVCGSGIGMAMSANKIRGVRAAVAWSAESGRLAKQHNDANVLCLGERLVDRNVAADAMRAWLTVKFEGGRHADRVALISKKEGA